MRKRAQDRWSKGTAGLITRNVLGALALASGLLSGSACCAQAQTGPTGVACAQLTAQPGELGYRARGGYCEGLYVQQVHSVLRLVSIVQVPKTDVAPPGVLAIVIPPGAPGSSRRLRVLASNPSVPYQLDASLVGNRFEWPGAAVVTPVFGRKPELDVLARTDDDQPKFMPVWLSADLAPNLRKTAASRTYISIVSTIPAESYVMKITGDGPIKPTERQAQLQPARTRLDLDIPDGAARGELRLWIRVRLLGAVTPVEQSWPIWLP